LGTAYVEVAPAVMDWLYYSVLLHLLEELTSSDAAV